MKKTLLLGILLLTACQPFTGNQKVTPELDITATHSTPTAVPVSSPLEATSTQTSTPSPTDTPIPARPERYFTEEFEAPLTNWTTLYASGNSGDVDIRNENSALTFELSSPHTWIYVMYSAFEYNSVHLETSAIGFGSDINAMGLVCHYSEKDGWYEFNISSDGNYNVLHGQWLADGIARYALITNETTKFIQTGNAVNSIGLECYGNELRLYINNTPLRTLNVENIGLTGGKVGLALASFDDAPLVVSFDWVKVSSLE